MRKKSFGFKSHGSHQPADSDPETEKKKRENISNLTEVAARGPVGEENYLRGKGKVPAI